MATLSELAAWSGASVRGSELGTGEISRVAAINEADGHSCVFATSAEALTAALASGSGAILASATLRTSGTETTDDPRVLWVADARYSFAIVAQQLRGRDRKGGVDASALVARSATVGRGTVIAAGAVIGEHARVGEDCRIGARACVLSGTMLGDGVVVQAGAVLGSDGFGYVRDPLSGEYTSFPQQGTLVIEDRVEIGANATIDRGALGETRIGRGTKIDNLVHIGHNCRIGQNVVIAAQTGIAGSSVVEDGAILGGQVGIADHVTIERGVILGAQAGVPTGKRLGGAGQVFWGTPARPIEQYLRDLAKLRRL